ncbi:MAG: metallophosphoesterase [Candidatus Cloacimonadaceae bacterium]|nr:metallophosphoesterase [Candidatus Cloacimonadaceae bacterium]
MKFFSSSLIILFLLICVGIHAQSAWNALGDTLTVIQMPILNVPAIHIPGETMTIVCIAPQSTSNWHAELIHKAKTIPLQVISTQFVSTPDRWLIDTIIPNVPVFEQYNLRVTASGGIDDTTQNAVNLIPSRKTSYYFAHVTDTHLPTRIYYPDAGYNTDSLSVNDFRAVIEDINLIRPEFVLLTGDLVNEGEMESLAGQYWYGWAQRIIGLIEVPVFLTNGNHDIGGWNSTPGPQGSSRRHWWRYFGWPWLNNSNSTWGLFTQDYSFTYGDIHYIGLESYINYDNWRANIYGGQSFIYSQMTWLNTQLALHQDKTKVLFYHYDFGDQLNLSSLGAQMGIWGHVHYNTGNMSNPPYNLGTRSVCDGNRSYRIVRVNGANVQPLSTIYAGNSGNNLNIAYYPANNAIADSVLAIFSNNQNVAFEYAMIKFNMPSGNDIYTVTNGVMEQIDRSGAFNVCYVRVNMAANSVKYVSIKATANTANDDPTNVPAANPIRSVYPNPFSDRLSILLDSARGSRLEVKVYNLRGERVRDLIVPAVDGISSLEWDGTNERGERLPGGIYLIRATTGRQSYVQKVVKSR